MSKTQKTVPIIEVTDDDFGCILNCAVRYSIGRETYMPKLVIDFITPLLPQLSNKTLWCFARDIERHEEERRSFGWDYDKDAWMKFLYDVRAEIGRRGGGEQK